MGLLNRKGLLSKQPLAIQKVDLENGDYVFVRQMTGRERDRYEQSLRREVKKKEGIDYEFALENFRAKLVVNTVCDEKGELLLRPSDFEVLSDNMSAYTMEKIVNAAQKLNNITEEDKEGLVKNSGAGQAGDSTLDCAGN